MSTHTHLTHPQFLRALALARYHGHEWASVFDGFGIDPAHRCDEWLGPDLDSAHPAEQYAWQRTRRSLRARLDAVALEALQRVELAWAARGEVAVADLEALTLATRSDGCIPGIEAPWLDQDGDTSHETGSGRLEWLCRRDGSVALGVCRPGREMSRIRVLIGSARRGWTDSTCIDQSLDSRVVAQIRDALHAARADGPMLLADAVALLSMEGPLVDALLTQGFTPYMQLPDAPEPSSEDLGSADLRVGAYPDGKESITVLSAEVGPEVETREYGDGTPATEPGHGIVMRRSSLVVTREAGPVRLWAHVEGGGLGLTASPLTDGRDTIEVPGDPVAPLYLRHVMALQPVLTVLGVEWEPRVEVVL